jgi:hypothetical protein
MPSFARSGEVGQNNLHRIWDDATGWESHLAAGDTDGEGNIVLARAMDGWPKPISQEAQ